MDITPFNIELVRQSPPDGNCVKACTRMVLDYYEHNYKKKEIKGGIHTYKKHSGLFGTYLQDVGIYLLKKGFKPEISHYDWTWWGEDQEEAIKGGKKQLMRSLDELKSEKDWAKKRVVEKEMVFIEKGGKFQFRLPQLGYIDAWLTKKIPITILVQAEFFYHRPDSDVNHAILIIGKKDDEYIIRDSLYAIDKIMEDELYYAWANAGGWMLAFPPKVKQRSKQEQLAF